MEQIENQNPETPAELESELRSQDALATKPSIVRRAMDKKRRQEGMTLVEIMIVVVIMALIATAASVAILPMLDDAKEKKARADAGTIKQAALSYILGGGTGCPTVEELIDSRDLEEDTDPADPWGHVYEVVCDGDNIVVNSGGEDEQLGTEDDITTRRAR